MTTSDVSTAKEKPAEVIPTAAPDEAKEDVQWPLTYRLKLPSQQIGYGGAPRKRWWSHELYRGPENKPVKILYSKDKAQSETIAQQFLNEPVLGFDMEWPWDSHNKHRLQDKIGLIQVACEDKIALFHIGLHPGKTTAELIAPSLRKIIESPDIAKTGVAVLNADMGRLAKFFGLKPKGAFELSHLHRLVTFGSRKPELVSTKLIKLASLVETHLGLPLSKGSVRTSDWSKALNQKQKDYAAADAYCGFMLYHCMNAKRLAMDPVPPLPLHADKYLPMTMPKIIPLKLQPLEDGGKIITSEEFYGVKLADKVASTTTVKSERPVTKTKKEAPAAKPEREIIPLDQISQLMFEQLSERRKVLAAAQDVPLYRIAHNAILEQLARHRPLDTDSLLKIKGIGKVHQEKYGADWLEVIQLFLALNAMQQEQESGPGVSSETGATLAADPTTLQQPTTPTRHGRRAGAPKTIESTQSSPAFETPPRPITQLHTGISFTLAETKLAGQGSTEPTEEESSDGDVFTTPPSQPTKRKRCESQSPQKSRQLTPGTRIFRNKIEAYSKLVASTMRPRPAEPLVSAATLDLIVTMPPRTREELLRIPGISRLAEACAKSNKDLLKTINKFAAARN